MWDQILKRNNVLIIFNLDNLFHGYHVVISCQEFTNMRSTVRVNIR